MVSGRNPWGMPGTSATAGPAAAGRIAAVAAIARIVEPPPGVGTDDERGHPEAETERIDLQRPLVVVPTAPVAVREHQGRAVPRGAPLEGRDHTPHERLTVLQVRRGLLTRSGRNDVR